MSTFALDASITVLALATILTLVVARILGSDVRQSLRAWRDRRRVGGR